MRRREGDAPLRRFSGRRIIRDASHHCDAPISPRITPGIAKNASDFGNSEIGMKQHLWSADVEKVKRRVMPGQGYVPGDGAIHGLPSMRVLL